MDDLLRPVTNRICSMTFCTSSSTTYWTIGLRATGSISLGCDLVAGSSLVPAPATGTIALLITSRLYWMIGKEKANGYPRTTDGVAAEDSADRPQVCHRAASGSHGAGHAARVASGALFRGRVDQWT